MPDIGSARRRLLVALRAIEAQKRTTPLERARREASMANSYTRIDAVMFAAGLSRLEWFALLGESWSDCDNISRWRPELRRTLGSASREELDAMMEPEELAAWAALPAVLTIYRGCYQHNLPGLSWTLERATAERSPRMARYWHAGKPSYLRIGQIRRDRAVLKLDRGEGEIITCGYVKLIGRELLWQETPSPFSE